MLVFVFFTFGYKKVRDAGGFRLLFQGRKPIASLAEGQKARIQGRVEALETLVAPFSGKSCVCFHLFIEVRKRTNNNHWSVVHEERRGSDFLLTDSAGTTAYIEALVVDLNLQQDESGYTSIFNTDEKVIAFARERGVPTEGFLGKRSIRIREGALVQGENATVTGEVKWEIDPTGDVTTTSYRETTRAKRVRMTGLDGGPVLISED